MTANGSVHVNGDAVHAPQPLSEKSDVCVVGAGPSGIMLGAILARFGIKVEVLDERPDQTAVGRADGLQPKTIETLQMMGLGDELLRDGVKVHDICMWRGSATEKLHRVSREIHYPADCLDVLHPFVLLVHQGMVEGLLIDDLRDSGLEVKRSHLFESFTQQKDLSVEVHCEQRDAIRADYLIGCDGARSKVRQGIPDSHAEGTPHRSVWGVLDGELDTNFPDIWSKTVVYSEEHGTVLIIPRERNMTRFYIEMKESASSQGLGQEFVMDQARRIIAPYRIDWRTVEWFGNYQVAQRVAARFTDPSQRIFIAGDASHTHSPKAAQGMNTSMHDSWNLGWKLNLAIRGLARPGILLDSYEEERKKIARDLINFDYEHATSIAGGDAQTLAENFRTNIRFIAGVGVEYAQNILNQGHGETSGLAKPGCTLPVAKVTRYIDANPIDIQLDIPVLGQFRVYAVVPNVVGPAETAFLEALSKTVTSDNSLISQLSVASGQSYAKKPRPQRKKDTFVRPERYIANSQLFTFALLTSTEKSKFELTDLPPLFAQNSWTVYIDDVPQLDTQGLTCTKKWIGELAPGEIVIMNVRPDGYVGSIKKWQAGQAGAGERAGKWLDEYYGAFLQVPQA
ncbi:FAD binding domain-containing protein [Thozetella sp. PMI_491]|nr:FAD binding domain-containing protein [Thozetella sp. PMI_491]